MKRTTLKIASIALALVIVSATGVTTFFSWNKSQAVEPHSNLSTESTAPTEEINDATTESTTEPTVPNEVLDESDATTSTEPTSNETRPNTSATTNNYTPTQNISGKADSVDVEDEKPVVVVVPSTESDDSSNEYEDTEVEAIVIPTVVTDGKTLRNDDTTINTQVTPDTTEDVKSDVTMPTAKDDGAIEDTDVEVGIELEEIEDGEMPDFLP